MDGEAEEELRIFVGGLGEKVTEEDLQKTFSSLGTVRGVEFVRTNGRSFAYINFQPSSAKSLSKLFSSYNGCVWKGGRLRLEKAKEHYMVRLRREWEEDAEPAPITNDELIEDENKDIMKKSKLLTLEKKQLQIFFPRLRKVKSVPYSGTGKHKYSFQRIEVPSLPIHFCDCEEHCGSSEIARVKQISDFEDQAGNINEEELNMMRSVMNKIFKKENSLTTEYSEAMMPMERENPNDSIDDAPLNESDADLDDDDDADNLVINIASGGKSKSGLIEKGRLESLNQESKSGKCKYSDIDLVQNKIKAQNEKGNHLFNLSDTVAMKNRQLQPLEGNDKNEFTSTLLRKKEHLETYPKESKNLLVAQPDEKGSNQPLATGISWRQNSSWRKLVGETANSSFNISNILPEANMRPNLPVSNDFDPASIIGSKRQKIKKQKKLESTHSEFVGLAKEEILQDKVRADGPSFDSQQLMKQGGCESTVSEPVELTKNDILQDKVSTDSPYICESTVSEPVELLKDEILEDTVSTDGPSDSKPAGLRKDEILQDKVRTDGHSIATQSGTLSNNSENPEEVKSNDQKASNHQTTGSRTWTQKSSWRELVGEMNSSSFSISHILPDIGSKRQKLQNFNNTISVNPFGNKQNPTKFFTSEVTGKGSNGVEKRGILHDKINPASSNMAPPRMKETSVGLDGVSDQVETNSKNKSSEGKNSSASNKKTVVETRFGEFCTFMRSSESEKEHAKIRAALSGTHKKKSNEKQ